MTTCIGPLAVAILLLPTAIASRYASVEQGIETTATPGDAITATPQGIAVLSAEDARAPGAPQMSVLVEATGSSNALVRTTAIRALGRLERRDVVGALLPHLGASDATTRAEAANAVAQAMRGPRLDADSGGQQVEQVLAALIRSASSEKQADVAAAIARSIGRLPYELAEQVARAESMLAAILSLSSRVPIDRSRPESAATAMTGAAAALELLARTARQLFSPNESTARLLRGLASGNGPVIGNIAASRAARLPALQAVISARLLDDETLREALKDADSEMIRRLGMLSLAGAGSPITGEDRARYIREGFGDRSYFVRYEAVRAYARHVVKTDGCTPLAQMVSDAHEHVVLAAIDALGDACAGDENAAIRLVAEARTPPDVGSWRRESHALVALARVSPSYAEIPLVTHARHNRWQVRMYAARAAVVLGDVALLERFAGDAHDNVCEVTLAPLKRLKKDGAEPEFIAALGRDDYQLLRTAARELAGMSATRSLTVALLDALRRVTAHRRETSRDTRLALLERITAFGGKGLADSIRPLLRDFDPRVAEAASATIGAWTGEVPAIDPQPLPRQPLPSVAELATLRERVAVLEMDSGKQIAIELDWRLAPLNAVRFLRLANAGYFDGLTFHRIVPNFVVQGGSPGANEYMGDGPFVRDEIGLRTHARGTIGLSTRGRDTGDAQIFINLVHNPRLDFDYTVFGHVVPRHLERIDEIHEGDRVMDVRFQIARSVR